MSNRDYTTESTLKRFATLALFLPAAAFLLASTAAADRPNILFITVDDMNWDSVGAFGCQVPDITPNIDQLAAQGMRFQQAYVTVAICQPTRAVWMTGRYPHHSGALGFDPINPGVPTLPETLKKAGYLTGIMAKERHVLPSRSHAWDVVVKGHDLKSGRDPQLYYERSKAFFTQAKTSAKPFFLMANAQDPHRPFAGSPQERTSRWRNKQTGALATASRVYLPTEVAVPGFLPDLPEVRRELAYYFTSVHRADEVVGSVLRALDESDLAAGTIVIFASDHGMSFPFAKSNCWYNSTRTPWIVRWPGEVKPGTIDTGHLISGIDFAPTMLEAVGLPPLAAADGRSYLPLLRGERQDGRDVVYTYLFRNSAGDEYPMRAVQDANFGYIYNAWSDGTRIFNTPSRNWPTTMAMAKAAERDTNIAARLRHFLFRTTEEFYDYKHDPSALDNLVGDPRYQQQLNHFRRLLLDHMQRTGDPQLESFRTRVSIK